MPFQIMQYKLMIMKNELTKKKFLDQKSEQFRTNYDTKIKTILAKALKSKMATASSDTPQEL